VLSPLFHSLRMRNLCSFQPSVRKCVNCHCK
jgi:hypothetical protein